MLKKCMLYCFLWACVSTVQAHPHNWIQLNSTFVLDDQARLIGIKQRWEFDFYYSMIMHADLLNEFGDELLGLSETATAMIKNLKPYTYFSELKAHDAVVDLGMPEKYQLTTTKVDGQLVLVLDMEFDIDQKIPVEGTRLEWRVFDPTYYIAMNHETERNIEIVGGNATECTKQLKFPEPTDEEIDYAQSLDKTQRDTDGLGQLFAETAFIECI